MGKLCFPWLSHVGGFPVMGGYLVGYVRYNITIILSFSVFKLDSDVMFCQSSPSENLCKINKENREKSKRLHTCS